MAKKSRTFKHSWKRFEDAARAIINHHKAHFEIEEMASGQAMVQGASGHIWSIEGLGYSLDGRKQVLFECRKRTRNIEPEQAGGFVFRIQDTGAKKGYFITIMNRKLGKGAKKIAEAHGVGLIQLNAEATLENYLMKHANKFFLGDTITISESISVTIRRSDGTIEERTIQ